MKSDFLHSFWPSPFWQADNKTAQTSPMVTHPIWKAMSSYGTWVHLRLMPHTVFNTHKKILTPVCTCTFPKPGSSEEAAGCTQTSARSQRQMVSKSGRLVPLPLFTSLKPFLNLHPDTHDSWHLEHVEPAWHLKRTYESPLWKDWIYFSNLNVQK